MNKNILKYFFMLVGFVGILVIFYMFIEHNDNTREVNNESKRQNNTEQPKLRCVETDCFPYKCQNDICPNNCTTNSDCVSGYNCINSSCVSINDNKVNDNTRIPGDQLWYI